MACQPNEASILAGMNSADPNERLEAINAALALGLNSAAIGQAAMNIVNNEDDPTLGPSIINAALQLIGEVGANTGGMESFLVGVVESPPVISYQSEIEECTQPEYADPDDPFPIDPITGEMWDPTSGNPYPMPTCETTTQTTTLDSTENDSATKAAAIGALETINEADTLSESVVDSLIDTLEEDVNSTPDEEIPSREKQASATFKLCSRVSKKVDKARRNRMGNKIRNKFYSAGKKKLGCGPAAYVGDIIKDMGDDASPLDPNNPNDQDILEVMDNCGTSMSDPTISFNCPGSRVKVGDEIDFAPTVTNSRAEVVMSSGQVVGDTSQMNISMDFGDGSSSSSSFTHTYNSAGQFTMAMSVTDNESGYTSIETCDFVVYSPVQVSIGDPTPSVVAPGDSVDVPVYTDGPVVVTPPDTTIDPPGGVVTVVAPDPPDTVVLTFVDEYGDPAEPPEIEVPIVIAIEPLTAVLTTDGVFCAGSSKEFDLDVGGPIDGFEVIWNVDGVEESGIDSLSVEFEEGNHSVFATVIDGTGRTTTSDQVDFEIYPRYNAYISETSLPSGLNVVPGLTINFDVCVTLCSGSSEPTIDPVISFPTSPGPIIPVPNNPGTYVFPEPGVYPVTAELPDLDITITEDIVVYGPPEIVMTYEVSPVCEGLVTFLPNITSGREPYRISLDVGDGIVYQPVNGISLDHQYKAKGSYVVSLIVKDYDDIVSIFRVVVMV